MFFIISLYFGKFYITLNHVTRYGLRNIKKHNFKKYLKKIKKIPNIKIAALLIHTEILLQTINFGVLINKLI